MIVILVEHSQTHIQDLVDIGFTPVEAEIYLFLLVESPASGYRIAQAAGKPAAQVYRALEALSRKGAAIMAEGKTRLWRAVPVGQCLDSLERAFAERRRRAEKTLRDLPASGDDERVYRLPSRDQVVEHCRSMIGRAQKILLLDLFPEPYRVLRDDVEAAAARGVTVAAKLYEPEPLEGAALLTVPVEAADVLRRWLGQQINVAVDGREYLTALLTREGRDVLNGFWSANSYLAAMHYNGMSCELCLSHLTAAIAGGRRPEELRGVLEQCQPFYLTNSPAMDAISVAE